MALEILTSLFQHLSPTPLTLSFQSMRFLFHRFASTNLGASDLFLTFCCSLHPFRWRRVTGTRHKQTGPECDCIKTLVHAHHGLLKSPLHSPCGADIYKGLDSPQI